MSDGNRYSSKIPIGNRDAAEARRTNKEVHVTDTGKNMFDLRASNRAAILSLLYTSGGMSRRDIAIRMNLTAAAISQITADMIEEGILVEAKKTQDHKMGRRAVILEIASTKYKVLCAHMPTRNVSISCFDLAGSRYFQKNIEYDASLSGKEVINGVCDEMQAYMSQMDPQERKGIVNIGFGVKGICDDVHGVSVTSFGLFEDNLPIREIVESRLGVRTLVNNDIRCMAFGDMFYNRHEVLHSMLFIKLGPLVGGAYVMNGNLFSGYNHQAMEVGHYVVDPQGEMCGCGKKGCLDTVIGFDVIAAQLERQYSAENLPVLYELTNGDKANISMETIMESYDLDDKVVSDMLDSALERFALMLVNTAGLVDPQRITLYGFPFRSHKFVDMLSEKVGLFAHKGLTAEIVISSRNLQLEDIGCAAVVINDFLSFEPKRPTA